MCCGWTGEPAIHPVSVMAHQSPLSLLVPHPCCCCCRTTSQRTPAVQASQQALFIDWPACKPASKQAWLAGWPGRALHAIPSGMLLPCRNALTGSVPDSWRLPGTWKASRIELQGNALSGAAPLFTDVSQSAWQHPLCAACLHACPGLLLPWPPASASGCCIHTCNPMLLLTRPC